jgi:hypothetical protein
MSLSPVSQKVALLITRPTLCNTIIDLFAHMMPSCCSIYLHIWLFTYFADQVFLNKFTKKIKNKNLYIFKLQVWRCVFKTLAKNRPLDLPKCLLYDNNYGLLSGMWEHYPIMCRIHDCSKTFMFFASKKWYRIKVTWLNVYKAIFSATFANQHLNPN